MENIIAKLRTRKRKDLLTTKELSKEEITLLLELASELKSRDKNWELKDKPLKDKLIATIFAEPSTRTRLSFTIAANKLGAHIYDILPSESSITKGETLLDTVTILENLGVHAAVIRHQTSGVLSDIAPKTTMSLINGGDGSNEHPTQAILDAMTIKEAKGKISGLTIAFVGDILHSRVTRSNVNLLAKFDNTIIGVCPKEFAPSRSELPVEVSQDFEKVLSKCDVVMMLRVQLERHGKDNNFPTQEEFGRQFGLGKKRLGLLKRDAIIMHPGPVNRGVELDNHAFACEKSVILKQVQNGVYARMAVFCALTI